MNYLAHSLLAGTDDPAFLVGNLVADHLKGRDALAALPAEVLAGVQFHRRVDRETDSHPIFRRTCARFRPEVRHFRGVLTDLFYDHVLATEWSRWGVGSLDEHSARVADSFDAMAEFLPPSLLPVAERIRSGVFFHRYATRQGMEHSLERIAGRLDRPSPLAGWITELDRLDGELRHDFAEFFPALRALLPPTH